MIFNHLKSPCLIPKPPSKMWSPPWTTDVSEAPGRCHCAAAADQCGRWSHDHQLGTVGDGAKQWTGHLGIYQARWTHRNLNATGLGVGCEKMMTHKNREEWRRILRNWYIYILLYTYIYSCLCVCMYLFISYHQKITSQRGWIFWVDDLALQISREIHDDWGAPIWQIQERLAEMKNDEHWGQSTSKMVIKNWFRIIKNHQNSIFCTVEIHPNGGSSSKSMVNRWMDMVNCSFLGKPHDTVV